MAWNAAFIWRRSHRFRVAYAAGGETISYGVARWTEAHLGELMDGADPVPATLFLWHLAEEIEHKSNTYDVFEATDGNRLRYAWAMTLGFLSIVLFTALGALVQLWGEKRLRYPVTWFRLVHMAVSMAFVLVPTMVDLRPSRRPPSQRLHRPDLPPGLARRQYDPVTETMPLWHSSRSPSTS